MTKKDANNFGKHVAEKQKIESRIKSILAELDSPEIAPGTISKLEIEAGEAGMRFENFKARHEKAGVPKNLQSEFDRLEYVFKGAKERSIAAKAKRDSLEAEKVELEQVLTEMHYQFVKGELAVILKAHQKAEDEKAALLKTIAENEQKKDVVQQDINDTKTTLHQLRIKRQNVLADMATGANKTSTSLDSVDLEINEITTAQNTAQQSLNNAEDTIKGLKALLVDAEQKAEAQRAEALEAVGLYLFDRGKIAGEKYSKAAAQLGQLFAELQALTEILRNVSGGKTSVGISVLDAHRLFLPTFLIGRNKEAGDFNGLLNIDQIDIPSMVQAEKENLKKMGFVG